MEKTGDKSTSALCHIAVLRICKQRGKMQQLTNVLSSFICDLWFGSVIKRAEQMKETSLLMPSRKIMQTFQKSNWKSSSGQVDPTLFSRQPRVKLLEYNTRKVACFVATEKTRDGDEIQRPVVYGNTSTCYHLLLQVACSNTHNHLRQFLLCLEKCWVTQTRWVWVNTTVLGMTVTDIFFVLKRQSKIPAMMALTIVQFSV